MPGFAEMPSNSAPIASAPDQASPAEADLGLDQPAQCRTRDQAVEGSNDQAVGGRQQRAIDLPAQDSEPMGAGGVRPLGYELAP